MHSTRHYRYGGEIDPQAQGAVNIREQLTREGFHFEKGPYRWTTHGPAARLFLTGPNTAHKFHPDSKKESEEFIVKALETAGKAPSHLRFATYTTRYNRCFWITVEGLERSYERADVEANRETTQTVITAKNVSRLKISGPGGEFELDGQKVASKASNPVFEKKNGRWSLTGRP